VQKGGADDEEEARDRRLGPTDNGDIGIACRAERRGQRKVKEVIVQAEDRAEIVSSQFDAEPGDTRPGEDNGSSDGKDGEEHSLEHEH
jgi:hypothetical protein